MFDAVSGNQTAIGGNNVFGIQLGDSGGFETTGYTSNGYLGSTAFSRTDSFALTTALSAATAVHGSAIITNIDGNKWTYMSGIYGHTSSGGKTLSDVLTQVRITLMAGGSFDAGTINIFYES